MAEPFFNERQQEDALPHPSEGNVTQLFERAERANVETRAELLKEVIRTMPIPETTQLVGCFGDASAALLRTRSGLVERIDAAFKDARSPSLTALSKETVQFMRDCQTLELLYGETWAFLKTHGQAMKRFPERWSLGKDNHLLLFYTSVNAIRQADASLSVQVFSGERKAGADLHADLDAMNSLLDLYAFSTDELPPLPPGAPHSLAVSREALDQSMKVRLGAVLGPIIQGIQHQEDPREFARKAKDIAQSVAPLIAEYRKQKSVYEQACAACGANREAYERGEDDRMRSYQKALGLEALPLQAFRTLLEEMERAPRPPPTSRDEFRPHWKSQHLSGETLDVQMDALRKHHAILLRMIEQWRGMLGKNLLTIGAAGSLSNDDARDTMKSMIEMLLSREQYEMLRSPEVERDKSPLMDMFGVMLQGLGVSYAMSGSPSVSVGMVVDKFQTLPPVLQEQLMGGMERYLATCDNFVVLRNMDALASTGKLGETLDGIASKLGSGQSIVIGAGNSESTVDAILQHVRGTPAADRVVQGIEGMEQLDVAAQRTMIQGIKEAEQQLGAQGISNAEFSRMLRKVEIDGRLGELLKTFNPRVTPGMYVILMICMFESDDKVNELMNFAMMLAAAGVADIVLEQGLVAASKIYGMEALTRLPPLARTVVILGLLIFGATKANEYHLFEKVDKMIPKCEARSIADSAIRTVFLDEWRAIGKDQLYANGKLLIRPEQDCLRTLSDETVGLGVATQGGIQEKGETLTGYYLTAADWNGYVDRAIAQDPSDIQRRKYELEKIDAQGEWALRQQYDLTLSLQRMRDEQGSLVASLKSGTFTMLDAKSGRQHDAIKDENVRRAKANANLTDAVIDEAFTCLTDIATGDEKFRLDRNDRELEWTLGAGSHSTQLDSRRPQVKAVWSFMEELRGVDPSHPLVRQWDMYLRDAFLVSKSVGLLRYLKMYRKREWFGDPHKSEYAPSFSKAAAAKLRYWMAREQIEHSVNDQRVKDALDAAGKAGVQGVGPSDLYHPGKRPFGRE